MLFIYLLLNIKLESETRYIRSTTTWLRGKIIDLFITIKLDSAREPFTTCIIKVKFNKIKVKDNKIIALV